LFSTIFYILILLYQNLYAGLGYNFNLEIAKVNLLISSKDYNQAIFQVKLLENKYVFRNESLYKTKVFLSIKKPTSFEYANLKSSEDYIIKSLILGQTDQHESSKFMLKEGLKLYPEKDTLIKLYELFSFISKNKEKRSSILTDEKGIVNSAFNTKDSQWMLDLLRKNEKLISY